MRTLVKHRHNNDAVSVDRLCKELQNEEDSPTIAYKPQGKIDEMYPGLSEDSFLLVTRPIRMGSTWLLWFR